MAGSIIAIGLMLFLAMGAAYMSAALDRVNTSVANLAAAVDAKLAQPAPGSAATEADLNSIADQIDAQTAKLTAPTV